MGRDAIIEKIMGIIEETFDIVPPEYADSLSAVDVEGWDSLSNIRFMVAVEHEFNRRLTMVEWQEIKCLGDLVALLS